MSVCASVYDCPATTVFSNGSLACFYQEIIYDMLPAWMAISTENLPWIGAMFGSILVGLSGVLPLLVIPIDETYNLKKGGSANILKLLLSFAVGGLLGDVFLHALPEIWTNDANRNGGIPTIFSGLLTLAGLLTFVAAEKIFTVLETFSESVADVNTTNNNYKGPVNNKKTDENDNQKKQVKDVTFEIKQMQINVTLEAAMTLTAVFLALVTFTSITGYLNLFANAIDNFTHGLSLGGAFLVSVPTGFFTTFAILVHEIPHEVGDFAILLKSGFTRWDAAKFQIITAGGGLIGALAANLFSGASNSLEARTSWILPFTAGSFLHISLVTVLPDLLKEENPWESFKQMVSLLLGILVMAFATTAFE